MATALPFGIPSKWDRPFASAVNLNLPHIR